MAIWLKFKMYIIAIAGAIATIAGIYFYGRKDGTYKEMMRQEKDDRKQARKIEDDADIARSLDADPIERLRKHKKLRDL